MPLTSTCRNCGLSKTMDYYAELYCQKCSDAVKAIRLKAIENNVDIGAATREVLAQLAHDVHRGRVNPKFPMHKSDYWAAGAPDAS